MKNQTFSELLDGELDAEDMELALDRVLADPEMQQSWHRMHAVRSAIQDDGVHASCDIVDKVAAAIAQEPAILAPDNLRTSPVVKSEVPANVVQIGQKRTKILAYVAIAASFAAIVMVSYSPREVATPTIADATQAPVQSMAAEQQLQSMIVQHGEFSGAAALNGLVAYAKVVNGSTVRSSR